MSLFNDELIARTHNRLRRLRHGVWAGVISTVVTNDLFYAHRSLFDFCGAFGVGRNAVIVGPQAAYGAQCIREQGARSVTGVITNVRIRRFATHRFASLAVTYKATEPNHKFDLVIYVDRKPRPINTHVIASDGILTDCVATPRKLDASARRARYSVPDRSPLHPHAARPS